MRYKNELNNINKMAYPILLNYLLTSVFEILDKSIIGHYSVEGFAVAGIAASIIYAITGALGILSVAFNIIAANEKGKQNNSEFERTFIISKALALIIGISFFIASILGGHWFFASVYGISGNELQELLSYFCPAAFTVIQNMLIFQYSAYFRNHLNTTITLYSTIISTIINLFFDYSLVYGTFGFPQLGTAGAAWGSVIGLFAGLLVYWTAYYKKFCTTQWSIINNKSLKNSSENIAKAKKILRLYPSLLGQEMLENTIFALVISFVVARLGTNEMAVYNLLDIICSTILLPVYAYATATQTLALQRYAAKDNDAVKNYLNSGITLSLLAVLMLCTLCSFFSNEIFHWIVRDENVINTAAPLLWFIFLIILCKIPYLIYMNFFQGIGQEKFVFLCTIIGTIIASFSVIVLGYILNLKGIYFAIIAEYFVFTIVYVKHSNR